MPRKKREESPTGVYHWIVRGMNRRKLFHGKQDHKQFLDYLREHKTQYEILMFHYCMMSNHVHALVKSPTLKNLSRFSHYVQRRYAYYYCKEYKHTGSVFQRGYRSFSIDKDDYLLECGRYIERNPVRAGIVDRPEDFLHTSYRYYTLREKNDLLTSSPAYLGLSLHQEQREHLYAEYVCQNRTQEEMMGKGLLRD